MTRLGVTRATPKNPTNPLLRSRACTGYPLFYFSLFFSLNLTRRFFFLTHMCDAADFAADQGNESSKNCHYKTRAGVTRDFCDRRKFGFSYTRICFFFPPLQKCQLNFKYVHVDFCSSQYEKSKLVHKHLLIFINFLICRIFVQFQVSKFFLLYIV